MTKKIKDDVCVKGFTNADSLMFDERIRQCDKGFNRKHDDELTDGSLLRCAMDILVGVHLDADGYDPPPAEWVVKRVEHINKKYLHAPIRRLVIAGALICAEIERLERAELAKKKKVHR